MQVIVSAQQAHSLHVMNAIKIHALAELAIHVSLICSRALFVLAQGEVLGMHLNLHPHPMFRSCLNKNPVILIQQPQTPRRRTWGLNIFKLKLQTMRVGRLMKDPLVVAIIVIGRYWTLGMRIVYQLNYLCLSQQSNPRHHLQRPTVYHHRPGYRYLNK